MSTPRTGAGGATGTIPVTLPPNPATPVGPQKQKPWQETPQGASLNGAYDSMRSAFQSTLPSLRQQFQTLARKPIGG